MIIPDGHTDLTEIQLLEPSLHIREQEYNASFRVYFFGPFRLFYQHHLPDPSTWHRTKTRLLLKWFILNAGKPFSIDFLTDLFWSDVSPETAHSNLHVTIHHLRRLLEPDLSRGQKSTYIRRTGKNCYQFEIDASWWADALVVPHLYDEARRFDKLGCLTKSASYYHKIIQYCNLGFLPEDMYEDCFRTYRQYYDRLSIRVFSRLIDISFCKNELDEALEYAYQALLLDPYYEPAIKAIVRVYLQQNNLSGAMRILNEFERFLTNELGMEPGADIFRLREEVSNRCATTW